MIKNVEARNLLDRCENMYKKLLKMDGTPQDKDPRKGCVKVTKPKNPTPKDIWGETTGNNTNLKEMEIFVASPKGKETYKSRIALCDNNYLAKCEHTVKSTSGVVLTETAEICHDFFDDYEKYNITK